MTVNISVFKFSSGILWAYKKLFDEFGLAMSDIESNIFRQIRINRAKEADYH